MAFEGVAAAPLIVSEVAFSRKRTRSGGFAFFAWRWLLRATAGHDERREHNRERYPPASGQHDAGLLLDQDQRQRDYVSHPVHIASRIFSYPSTLPLGVSRSTAIGRTFASCSLRTSGFVPTLQAICCRRSGPNACSI